MKRMTKSVMLLGALCIAVLTIFATQLFVFNVELVVFKGAALVAIAIRYMRTVNQRAKLFWRFLLLAILTSLTHDILSYLSVSISLLIDTSISLIAYFFIILAIESNPHLSYLALKRHVSSIVSLLVFCSFTFCYFVLIPYELTLNGAMNTSASLVFHVMIFSLLTARLFLVVTRRTGRYFNCVYLLMGCAGNLVLLRYSFEYWQIDVSSNVVSLLSFLPYVLLTSAAMLKEPDLSEMPQNDKHPTKPDVDSIMLTLMMMLSLSLVHLIGTNTVASYITNNIYQSLVVVAWLVIGSGVIMFNIHILSCRNLSLSKKLKTNEQLLFASKQREEQINYQLINSEDTAIVNASNNAILTVSMSGECLSANPAAVQMFQYLAPQLVGMHISTLFDDSDEMHYFFNFESNVFSLERNIKGLSQESVALRSDKVSFPVQVALQWAERKDSPLIVITFINLTERKRQETLNLELKDRFIANISHEFRTPLTIINGILDRYLSNTNADVAVSDIKVAKRNGLRLVTMVEQLLELSRLRDNPTMTMNYYRLESLMAMPIDSFSRLAAQNKLTFNACVPTDIWLQCDAQAFEKIIFNLLSNAVKYTPEGGSLDIVVYEENESVFIDIIDTGIGISPSSQRKIFERFERAEDVKNQSIFGVGIGLSLVNELVNAHAWRISVHSELGKGSKFSLALPVAQSQPCEGKLDPSKLNENLLPLFNEPQSVSTVQKSHSHKVVLVIEDNVDMQSHIKQVIETRHHCLLAGSGEVGLDLANEYLPDLIVCDLMLTGIDGFEVLRKIKSNEMTAHIPVVLLTARSDLESKLQGLNLSADDYLGKPFQQKELLTRIQSLIDNREMLQSAFQRQQASSEQSNRLIDVKANLEKLTASESGTVNFEDQFVERLQATVALHYMDPLLDVSFIAKEMAMSERQLQRKIKVILGTTTNNFLKELRLDKAKAILLEGQQIGRVAMDVGFSSQTYFGRCFKEKFGCTPKEYQKNNTTT